MDSTTSKRVQRAVGGFLGTDRQAPSLTWRKETKTCKDCGQGFIARIANDGQGDLPFMDTCPDCEEKRRRQEYIAERKALLEKACREGRQAQLEEIPATFRDKTFENFNKSLQPRAYHVLTKYDWNAKPRRSIVLLSPDLYGVGKTHLACALAHKIIEETAPAVLGEDYTLYFRLKPVLFVSENRLLARIRATYNHKSTPAWEEQPETEEDVFAELDRAPLLIIDDVGKVRPNDLKFLQSVYFRVIDTRYNDGKPIVLTSNLDYGPLEEHLGGACADRLREMADFVKMAGKSYRIKPGRNQ